MFANVTNVNLENTYLLHETEINFVFGFYIDIYKAPTHSFR